MTSVQKYALSGMLAILAVVSSTVLISAEETQLKYVAWLMTIIFVLTSFVLSSKATDMRTDLVPGRVYRLVSYRRLKNDGNVVNFVTLRFQNKHGHFVIYTFLNPEFENKEVSFQYEDYDFIAVAKDKKIILVFAK